MIYNKFMSEPLVSVIIPSFNRFDFLKNAINSVKNQTYKNLEIIVINDCSTDERYYKNDFGESTSVLNLETNQKEILGYISAGHIRNFGLEAAKGKYVAFLDDDDIWFDNKIELQVRELENSDYSFSCTEGLVGKGVFDQSKEYLLYNQERFYKKISKKHKKNIFDISNFEFPDIFDFEFIKTHNSIVTSSVLVERKILDLIGGFRPIPTKNDYAPDYDCWLGILRISNCIYIKKPLFYYDELHGSGRIW